MVDTLTKSKRPHMPWDQQPSESDDEHAAFLVWLHAEPRPAPADVNPNLSPTWRERAYAWDLQRSLYQATGDVQSAKDLMCFVLETYITVATIESYKMLQASMLGERTMNARDLRDMVALGKELTAMRPADEGDRLDLAQATPEEMALVMKALPVLARLRKKKEPT